MQKPKAYAVANQPISYYELYYTDAVWLVFTYDLL